MVIYTHDFMAACNLHTPPQRQPTSCVLLLLHLLSIFLFAPLVPFPLLFQFVLKKTAAGWEIFSEHTPISYHAGEISEQEHGR